MIYPAGEFTLDNFLESDQGRYGYLFPDRGSVPKIKKIHMLALKESGLSTDKFLIKNMMNVDYIGWTVKTILNIELFPIQIAVLRSLWNHTFPMLIASRGGSKSFMLAIYAVIKAILEPGTSIVIVGSGLRQAKLVFNYIDTIWNKAPVLRSIVGGGKKAGPRQNVDLCYFRIGDSIIYALPLGDGSKIRGFRANVVIADEFASIPEDVFDIVVRGFAATAKTPVEEARRAAFERDVQKLTISDQIKSTILQNNLKGVGNQIIYSGTAYYGFNHFARRHEMWQKIIRSKGDQAKIADIFGGPNLIPDKFSYKDYVVIRIPYTNLPEGLLDLRQLAHAKAILPKNIFLMEYGATFVKDSDGFYPRSLIESCTTGHSKKIDTPDGPVSFTPLMRGDKAHRYILGVDPAAERDNFAITIIELWQNHFRVVYCWSINKKIFLKRKMNGLVTDDDYYAYCCSKMRDLVKLFTPFRIEMDSQGGGYPIAEMLRNKKMLDTEDGEFPIYEVVDHDEPKDTDAETDGPHILHLVKQSSEFNASANVCMHKSFETHRLLFPAFDVVKMQSAIMLEKSMNVTFDTYEDNVNDIEELKNEICTIHMSETSTGKERFDTPSIIHGGAVEGRQRRGRLLKDRYTGLLLAHKYVYDTETSTEAELNYEDVAGNFKRISKTDPNEGMYKGPGMGQMRNASDWIKGQKNLGATKKGERI